MAAGIPVACSDIPPLREVAGSTVQYFDPSSDTAIRESLEKLIAGSIPTQAAAERAALFTWRRTAQATLDYLSKCSS
jgi:glycosyltransferase involved in cell wall biosynthesis